eukprot:3524636-Rhodomonas_salina.1
MTSWAITIAGSALVHVAWMQLAPPVGCTPCAAGGYCPLVNYTGTFLPCQPNADSPSGSTSVDTCVCRRWHHLLDTKCLPCPVDAYCPGGAALLSCPPGTTAPGFTGAETDCRLAPGFYGVDPVSPCPAGSYCPGGRTHEAQPCPAYSTSQPLVIQLEQCSCVD